MAVSRSLLSVWATHSLFLLATLHAQLGYGDSLTLEQCIDYAEANQPNLRAAREELALAELDNKIAVSAWLPSLAVTGNAQHYFQLPVSIFPDFENPQSGELVEVEIGTVNSSTLSLTAEQAIYNPTVAAAVRRQSPLLASSRLAVEEQEIELRRQISTAFYQALRAQEQLQLLTADVSRQERALENARLQFENGLVDKVDYKRATITLNETQLALQNAIIERQNRIAELAQLMAYPDYANLALDYDFDQLTARVLADTTASLDPARRVELRRLLVEDRLVELEGLFYRRAWLPDLYLSGSYNYNWQSNEIRDLYNRAFPNSLVSVNMSLPLFTGGRRFRQIERQGVLRRQISFESQGIREQIEREYRVATGQLYQARNTYAIAEENLALAREIYEVVMLQYREGIEPFLEVIIAENDLQAARLNMVNGLIDAALARVEVQRAAGTL